MVCDATYRKNNVLEDELGEAKQQYGFKNEKEYLAFVLNIEKVWEQEHLDPAKPEENNSG